MTPRELENSGILQVLDASVLASEEPTCTKTGRTIDFFVISRSLLKGDEEASVMHGYGFETHLPVGVVLNLRNRKQWVDVLPRPKPFPIEQLVGPMPPGALVEWGKWSTRREIDSGARDFDEDTQKLLLEWYAGAEVEVSTRVGIFGTDEETNFSGIGLHADPQKRLRSGRYRDVTHEDGLLGVRLSWMTGAMGTAVRYAQTIRTASHSNYDTKERAWAMAVQLVRVGGRSRSLIHEKGVTLLGRRRRRIESFRRHGQTMARWRHACRRLGQR